MTRLPDPGALRGRHLVALAAGVAAVGGSYLAVGFTRNFVVVAVAATVLQLLPGQFLAIGIQSMGNAAQPLLVLGSGLLTVLLYAGLTLGLLRLARSEHRERAEVVFGVFGVTALATFLLSVTFLGALVAGAAAGLVVAVAGRDVNRPAVSVARRRLLRAGAVAVGAVGVGVLARYRPADPRSRRQVDDPQIRELLDLARTRSLAVGSLEGLVSDEFYTVDIASADPQIDPEEWSLTVSGLVDEEASLTMADIRDFPTEHRFVTLRCVGEELNGKKMDTALWTGVPIRAVLDEVGAPESCCVTLRGADDYFVSFPREALNPGMLAFRMNGFPLPRAHGSPLRALVPGHWGETNMKWITEIEIRESEGAGYWEHRGWHGTGPVNTIAKLHGVETAGDVVRIGGHAYAGTRGIRRVEVSTDGGDSWEEATLSEPLPGVVPADGETVEPTSEAADAWRMWTFELPATREYDVTVRAVDGTGTVQPQEREQPFPSGATGWVSKRISP